MCVVVVGVVVVVVVGGGGVCVCVCVCVSEIDSVRERERESMYGQYQLREPKTVFLKEQILAEYHLLARVVSRDLISKYIIFHFI